LWPRSVSGWLALFALAWISQAVGQGLIACALGHLQASSLALAIVIEPVTAATLGWLWLAEALGRASGARPHHHAHRYYGGETGGRRRGSLEGRSRHELVPYEASALARQPIAGLLQRARGMIDNERLSATGGGPKPHRVIRHFSPWRFPSSAAVLERPAGQGFHGGEYAGPSIEYSVTIDRIARRWPRMPIRARSQAATVRLDFASNPCKAVTEGDVSFARQIIGVMTFANTAGSRWRANPSLRTTSRTDSGKTTLCQCPKLRTQPSHDRSSTQGREA
jgi:hypothetical protein